MSVLYFNRSEWEELLDLHYNWVTLYYLRMLRIWQYKTYCVEFKLKTALKVYSVFPTEIMYEYIWFTRNKLAVENTIVCTGKDETLIV